MKRSGVRERRRGKRLRQTDSHPETKTTVKNVEHCKSHPVLERMYVGYSL